MQELKVVRLDWVGPFKPVEDNGDLKPPREPGVYLWVVGKKNRLDGLLVIYVGKAANLSQRLYEHTYSMLGGRYYLYDPDKLEEGIRCTRYCSGSNQLGREFYDNPQRVQELALANARVYRFYWALVEKSLCEVVEWCLIDALRNSADSSSLDWSRRGFRELQEPNIRIENPLPKAVKTELVDPLVYPR